MPSFKKIRNSVNKSKQKINFLSAILIVVGATIGSGVFLKSSSVLSNSWYSFPLAIATWIIAAIGVICLSLALIEVCSSDISNLSLIGWVKNFNKKIIFKLCKNYIFYLSVPLSLFYLPIYAMGFVQDALLGFNIANNFNTNCDFLIWALFAFLITFWFLFTSGLNVKFGNIQNWIISIVKFFPLAIIAILGFTIASINGANNTIIITPDKANISNSYTFVSFSPIIGMFLSFAAIFYAFDGFYYSNGIQTEMKNPKKAPLAQFFGIGILTFIYLLISTAMSVAYPSNGSFKSFSEFLFSKNLGWLYSLVNLMIAFGIFGVINGIVMWATHFSEDLVKQNQLPFAPKFVNKINPKNNKVGLMYVVTTTLIIFISFTLLGGFLYFPYGYTDSVSNYSLYDGIGYYSMAKLLAFVNLMSNWKSMIIFFYLMLAIIGGLINRKTNKVKVVKNKFFIPTAIVAITIVGISTIFQFIAPFVDLIMIFIPNIKAQLSNSNITSRIMIVIVFFVYLLFMWLPIYFDPKDKSKINQTTKSKINA